MMFAYNACAEEGQHTTLLCRLQDAEFCHGEKNIFPLPRVEDCIEAVGNANYLTKIDSQF